MPGQLTSAHNDRVVAARRLRQRKARLEQRRFLVEGPHAVSAALTSERHRVREVFVTADASRRDPGLGELAATAGARTTVVSAQVAASLADTVHPQGVVAVVDLPSTELEAVMRMSPRLLVVLVAAADPGNTGTIIRTADAMGADAVVLTSGSVDPYGGKVVRASAGSILNLPVVTDVDPQRVLAAAAAHRVRSLAATVDGVPLDAVDDLGTPTAWLFGNEAHGLPADVAAAADVRVRVPMFGKAESLNLAAAAAICLHATAGALRS